MSFSRQTPLCPLSLETLRATPSIASVSRMNLVMLAVIFLGRLAEKDSRSDLDRLVDRSHPRIRGFPYRSDRRARRTQTGLRQTGQERPRYLLCPRQ
jgi:hypothetical protein